MADPRDPFGHKAFEFKKLDKNGDGVLSPDELHEGLLANGMDQDDVSSIFEKLDVNKVVCPFFHARIPLALNSLLRGVHCCTSNHHGPDISFHSKSSHYSRHPSSVQRWQCVAVHFLRITHDGIVSSPPTKFISSFSPRGASEEHFVFRGTPCSKKQGMTT